MTVIPLLIPSLALDTPPTTPEAQVWQLLCAATLVELDAELTGVHADDLAAELYGLASYRALEPKAAAYLWFATETAEPEAPDS